MADFEAVFRVLKRRTGAENQADVAIRSGISPNDLSAWKVGRQDPTLKKLQKIARHFGISPEALLSEIEAESASSAAAPPKASRGDADGVSDRTQALTLLRSNAPELAEHIDRQMDYLSMIPKLREEVRALATRVAELEGRRSTGKRSRKKARSLPRPTGTSRP